MSRRSPVIALALLVPLLVAGLSPLTAPPVRAEAPRQDRPIQLTARAGFDGYVQTDAWTPVRVEASNDGADISGEIRVTVDPFTGTRTHYTRPLDLPRGSRKQVTLYVADIAAFGGQVEVELLDARGRVLLVDAARVQTVAPTTLLIGVWRDAPQGLAAVARVEPARGGTRVGALAADGLPAEARGWEALDVLVVADADTGQLSLAQREALSAWVAGGGRLVIVGGLGFQRTLAGLADLTPVRARQTEAVRLDALQEMAGGAGARVAGEAPVAVGPLTGDARVALAQDGVPLVAWRPLGYGRVDFFAPDPNLAPLNRWDGLEAVWRSILARGEARPAWAYGFSGQWEYARQAVAAVPGITLPSVLQLSAFLALYVVLIGPVNYVVLTRLNRRELAWVTIPALIVLFSVVAYVTGFQLRGSRAILHRLAVVQSWEGSDLAQVDGLVGVWSPRRARYGVELEAGVLAQPLDDLAAVSLHGAVELGDVAGDEGAERAAVAGEGRTAPPRRSGPRLRGHRSTLIRGLHLPPAKGAERTLHDHGSSLAGSGAE